MTRGGGGYGTNHAVTKATRGQRPGCFGQKISLEVVMKKILLRCAVGGVLAGLLPGLTGCGVFGPETFGLAGHHEYRHRVYSDTPYGPVRSRHGRVIAHEYGPTPQRYLDPHRSPFDQQYIPASHGRSIREWKHHAPAQNVAHPL
jgi:hypothetical protein